MVPGGVSAIFDPYIYADPFISGARGAGIGVENAVEISLSIKHSNTLEVLNFINGERIQGGIGETTVRTFLELLNLEPKFRVEIHQNINIPIGSGFGTSAASALGITLLLSKALKIPLTLIEAGDIAHIAEIRAKSGLGTVSGLVFLGDIVIVSRPGAPSICLVDKIILDDRDIYLVLASRGRIETAKALSKEDLITKASMYGKVAVDKLIKNPTLDNFFKISRLFSERLGLLTRELSTTMDSLRDYVLGVAQAMIGNSIFAMTYKENVEEVKNIIADKMNTEPITTRPVRAPIRTLH